MQKRNQDIPLFERLVIESQSNCNRDCWFCPRTYDRSGHYLDESGQPVIRQMPTDTILELLDQAQELGFDGEVCFYLYSEPLLDPRNPMLAREAKQRGMMTRLHTNGDVLARDDTLCKEVKKLYDLIVIGIYDYCTQEELEEAKHFWNARLSESRFMFSFIKDSANLSLQTMGIPRALVPTDSRMGIPDVTFVNAPCQRPLIRMLIRHDGEMCNCCEDVAGVFQLGNIDEHTIGELWFSERHLKVVQDLKNGQRDSYPLCRNCPLSPSVTSPPGTAIRIKPRRYAP